jgi:hypothetical protein
LTATPARPDVHLLVTWHGIERTWALYDPKSRGFDKESPNVVAFRKIPPRITLFFDKDVKVENVRFDHVHAGGLLLRDPSAIGQWRNVSWGPNNDGPSEELVAPGNVAAKGGTY